MVKLSKRLMAVAALVTPGNRIADVGTDHGYIPIYLVQQGNVAQAIAMDVKEGPLMCAEEHIAREGLCGYIKTKKSDGVKALEPGEVDSVIIAGMGGDLVMKILSEGRQVCTAAKEIILQPQSELEKVRHFIYDNGYHITKEDMVLEDGKYYPMMRIASGRDEKKYPPAYFRYGGFLIQESHPVLCQFLDREEEQLFKIKVQLEQQGDGTRVEQRISEIIEKLKLIRDARREMENI